jgi:hypothetical protein
MIFMVKKLKVWPSLVAEGIVLRNQTFFKVKT